MTAKKLSLAQQQLLEDRLAKAEAQLWELSLTGEQPDALLPPALLQAALSDVRNGKQKKRLPYQPGSSDISYLHEQSSPRARPNASRRPHSARSAESGLGSLTASVAAPLSARPATNAAATINLPVEFIRCLKSSSTS